MSKAFKSNISASGTVTATGDIASGGVLKSTMSMTNEGGQIELSVPSSGSTLSGTNVTIDIYQNKLRFFEQGGTNRGFYIDITSGASSAGSNLAGGSSYTAPTLAGTTLSSGGTINTLSGTLTADQFAASNNGLGTNFKVGDDAWIRVKGQQNSANGYIVFGDSDATALGRSGTGALTYGGYTIWHSNNDGAGSGLDADTLDGFHASSFITSAVTSITAGTGLSGGTITTTGTISLATAYGDTVNPFASKTANTFLSAPNGSAGLPTFRAIVAADLPIAATSTSGIVSATTQTFSGNKTISGDFSVTGKSDIVYDTDNLAGQYGIIYAGATAPASPTVGDIWVDDSGSNAGTTIIRWRALATSGQITISGTDTNGTGLSYNPGYEQVYINGVLLYRGSDYTATNGTSITFTNALILNDTIEVIAPQFVTFLDYYTQAQSDAKYSTIASPTFTGTVSIPAMTSTAGNIGEVITARSTTTQTGTSGGNIIGNATITLTPGTWLVQGLASIIMSVNADGVNVGIYNSTSGTEVASSRGATGYATTTAGVGLTSMQTVITVASNTIYAPYICRNGASTIATTYSALGAANAITALRIR
jgi:hypothetical protein